VRKLAVKMDGDWRAVVEMRTKEVEILEGKEPVCVLTWDEVDTLAELVAKARGAKTLRRSRGGYSHVDVSAIERRARARR